MPTYTLAYHDTNGAVYGETVDAADDATAAGLGAELACDPRFTGTVVVTAVEGGATVWSG